MMRNDSNFNQAVVAVSSVPLTLAQAIATEVPAQDVNLSAPYRATVLENSYYGDQVTHW